MKMLIKPASAETIIFDHWDCIKNKFYASQPVLVQIDPSCIFQGNKNSALVDISTIYNMHSMHQLS